MVTAVLGREAELVAVDKLLDSGRRGRAALVLEGNPGIGKTTVWRHGISRAADARYRVLTCRTAPTEARLSFTALSDLLTPLESAAFASLPDPQRRALDAALLRADAEGAAANPRAIGTAVVSLLSRLAASGAGAARDRRPAMARQTVGPRARIRVAPARGATDRGARDRAARRARRRSTSARNRHLHHRSSRPAQPRGALSDHRGGARAGLAASAARQDRASVRWQSVSMRSRLRARSNRQRTWCQAKNCRSRTTCASSSRNACASCRRARATRCSE